MIDFFKDQMDYIYFFYGLAFIMLAAVCFVLMQDKEQRLPWAWLGLFGLTHGLHEWMDLITFSFGSNPSSRTIHLLLLGISFMFLLEFGRAGVVRLSGKGPGRWIFVPLLAFAAMGGVAGLQGVYASLRYVFGITGGALSAVVLFMASKEAGPFPRRWLVAGSVSIGLYALAAGVIVPYAPFPPASLLNNNAFLNTLGVPVQLIRGLLAIFSAISIWAYSQAPVGDGPVSYAPVQRRTFLPVGMLIALIISGWIFTHFIGNYAKKEDINESNLYTSSLADHLTHLLEDAKHISAKRAGNPAVARALMSRSPQDIEQARFALDLCSDSFDCDSTLCYLTDASGKILISCHQGGNTGLDGGVSRLFKNNPPGKPGEYYAFEGGSKRPVYYANSPVRSKEGKLLGYVVIKRGMEEFEVTLNKYPYCFLIDPLGIVFLSSREDMKLKSLWPVKEKGFRKLSLNGYFSKGPIAPILSKEVVDGNYASVERERLLATRWVINQEGWSIVLLNSIGHIRAYRLFSIFTTFVFCSLAIAFFVVMYFKDEAAGQLESTVRERTTELSETNRLLQAEVAERKKSEGTVRQMNAKLQGLLGAIPEMVYFKDTGGRHLAVNRAVEEFTGKGQEDLIGRTQAELLPPDLAEECGKSDREVLETRREVRFEEQVTNAAGGVVFLDTIKAPIFDSEGQLAGTVGVSRDITERKQMEAALRDSEERFRTLFDMASDCILLLEPSRDGEAVIVDANIAAGEMHGYTRDELIGKPIVFLNAPESLKQSPELVKRLMDGHAATFEIKHVRKDGIVFPVEVSAKLIYLGGAPYILGVDRDITKRKEAEDQLQSYTLELEKYSGELARSNRDLKLAEEELRRYREHLEDLVRARTIALIRTNESFQQEITERQRAEETLKESEARFRKLSMEFHSLFNSIPDALMLLSPDLKIVWANSSAAAVFGRAIPDVTGLYCHELWHNKPVPCDNCPAVKSLKSGKTESAQSTTDDGRFWNVRAFPTRDDDGEISNVIVLTGDITEKITLQAETIRAGQLASIGELAAGVAHEINNPVNSIINYAQVLLDEKDTDVAAKIIKDDIAGRIIKEGGRIAGIIKSLLSFARDRKEEKQPVNVHLTLLDSLTLVEAQMRKDGVSLRVEMPPDLPEIFGHYQQIQQVFLNIINNARYALNQKYKGIDKGKKFEIYGEEVMIDICSYVRLRFNDRGTGIPVNIIDKIMNPFFSTKPSSKGTGLGLSISHGIINDHGGRLTIESIEGEFTNVIIDLPVMGCKERG